MLKSLKLDTFYNTKVEVKVEASIAQLFNPYTTFIFRLNDGTWVFYQLEFREFFKDTELQSLLNRTFAITVDTFYHRSYKLTPEETKVIQNVFELSDNYNLDIDNLYKLI